MSISWVVLSLAEDILRTSRGYRSLCGEDFMSTLGDVQYIRGIL